MQSNQLKPTLSTWHLWGLAVGLVISGEYFGWSYGWASAGTLGFFITSVVIAVMYTSFIFSFTEHRGHLQRRAVQLRRADAHLVLACVCLVTMLIFNPLIAAVFTGFMVACYLAFMVGGSKRREAAALAMSGS